MSRSPRLLITRDRGLRAGIAALCLFHPSQGAAQVSDSLARATSDTTAAPAGTPRDTARPVSTTSAPAKPDTVSPVPPADTTLTRVCKGAAPGSLAPGLLAVVFRPGTTKPEAIEAARAVGGTIAGMSPAGEVYVELAQSTGLAVVADELIRQNPVTRVTPTPCPAPRLPTPPAPAPPADTGAQKARDSTPGVPVRSGP